MAEEFLGDRRKEQEEKYFHERNRELIEKLRQKAEAERKEMERKHRKDQHWMKCPKCGHDLEEQKMGPLLVDKCADCGGVFFDAGELDVLLAAEKEGSILRRLFKR